MFNFLKKKKEEKCAKCDKAVHKIEGWYGDTDLQNEKPLKSNFCIDHLVQESPKDFNKHIINYAKNVNEYDEKMRKKYEKSKTETHN